MDHNQASMFYAKGETIWFSRARRQRFESTEMAKNKIQRRGNMEQKYHCHWGFLSGRSFLIWLEHILDERVLDGQEFREFVLQLGCIELIVAPWRDDHFGLLIQSEVLPCEIGVNELLVHLQDLIVAHHSWVGEVPYSSEVSFCHFNGDWKEFVQDCHWVWDVDNLLVSSNLCNEVARIW